MSTQNQSDDHGTVGKPAEATLGPTQRGNPFALGAKGFLLTLCALGLPLIPLVSHQSETAQVGSYSTKYFFGLITLATIVLFGSLVVGWVCRRRGDLRVAQATALVVIICAGMFTLGEVVCRWTMPDAFDVYRRGGFRKSAIFGFEVAPNNRWTQKGVDYSSDRFGFRTNLGGSDWHEKSPDSGSGPLVFTVGASSVFGFKLNDDETWPHLLQNELRQANPDRRVTVVNAGNSGHNSLQTLMRFYLRVLPHKPAYVLYYQARNDVNSHERKIDDAVVVENILFSTTLNEYLNKKNRNKNFYVRTNLGYALDKSLSQFVKAFDRKNRVQLDENPEPYVLNEREQAALLHNGMVYLRNVQTLADVCQREGVKLVLMTFLHDAEHIKPRYYSPGILKYNELIRGLAKQEDLPLIDLEKAFAPVVDKSPFFGVDSYHPSVSGAEYIAKRTARTFDEILRREKTDGSQ